MSTSHLQEASLGPTPGGFTRKTQFFTLMFFSGFKAVVKCGGAMGSCLLGRRLVASTVVFVGDRQQTEGCAIVVLLDLLVLRKRCILSNVLLFVCPFTCPISQVLGDHLFGWLTVQHEQGIHQT